MTRQYLAGELSVLLAGVQAVTSDQGAVRDLVLLRREAETRPVSQLGSVLVRAVSLVDAVCWESVAHGDVAAFHRQAVAAGELYEFGVCAGVLAQS